MIETGLQPPYSIRQMGIYLVVDTKVGLVLLWDKGTSIFLRLSPEFKVRPHPRPRATGDGGSGRGETETLKQRQKETSRGTQGETERQETGERDGEVEGRRGAGSRQQETLGHVWVLQLLEKDHGQGALLPKAAS